MDKSPQQSEHPPEHILLRYLDGELDVKRAAAIRAHLEACWRCRTETDELQETIRDYMHFHKDRIVPSLPGPPRYWHGFAPMLRQAESESATALRWKNWFFALNRMMPRIAWVGGAVAACIVAVVVFLEVTSGPSNSASAAEILHRAVLSDAGNLADQPHRVRIRFRGQAFVRKVGNVRPAKNDAIEPLFRSSGLDWNYPLSARAFADWHNGLHTKLDRVRFASDRIAVETNTDEGKLRHASFTVRSADYRPIEESLDFGQSGTVEVSALPNEAEEAATHSLPKAEASSSPDRKVPTSSSSLTDDAEAHVRLLLHLLGADIQEVLSIRRSGDEIEVTGVVGDFNRKQEIVNRIGTLDHVAVQIQSAQEFAAQPSSQTSTPFIQNSATNYDAPAKLWLEQEFPNDADRDAFVHRALQLTHGISVRAYALSQLATRYPAPAFHALSPTARAQITQIIGDLAAGINDEQEALRAHLRPLVVADSMEPPSAVWQSATAQCLTMTRGVNSTLTNLFAASPQPPGEFDALVQQLGSQLAGVCRIQVEQQ